MKRIYLTNKQKEMKFHIRNHGDELTEIPHVWFKAYIRRGLKVGESLFFENRGNPGQRHSFYYINTTTKNAFDLQWSLQSALKEKPITIRKLKI